jgi:hypothetical protein
VCSQAKNKFHKVSQEYKKDFNLTFSPLYAKRLQHVPNMWKFQNLNANFTKTLYLGTDALVPRTIVLGDYNDFHAIAKNNSILGIFGFLRRKSLSNCRWFGTLIMNVFFS